MGGTEVSYDDEARDMADPEPRPFHRCPWPDYYGCRICSNRDDDDQPPEDNLT